MVVIEVMVHLILAVAVQVVIQETVVKEVIAGLMALRGLEAVAAVELVVLIMFQGLVVAVE
jgi:hypothetical protein